MQAPLLHLGLYPSRRAQERAPQDEELDFRVRNFVIAPPSFALSSGSASDALAVATTASGAFPSRSSQQI
jgi:hypothetical protein